MLPPVHSAGLCAPVLLAPPSNHVHCFHGPPGGRWWTRHMPRWCAATAAAALRRCWGCRRMWTCTSARSGGWGGGWLGGRSGWLVTLSWWWGGWVGCESRTWQGWAGAVWEHSQRHNRLCLTCFAPPPHRRLPACSKAVGCLGGFVACSRQWKDFLVNRGRSQVYSTALPVPVVAAALAALKVAAEVSPPHCVLCCGEAWEDVWLAGLHRCGARLPTVACRVQCPCHRSPGGGSMCGG